MKTLRNYIFWSTALLLLLHLAETPSLAEAEELSTQNRPLMSTTRMEIDRTPPTAYLELDASKTMRRTDVGGKYFVAPVNVTPRMLVTDTDNQNQTVQVENFSPAVLNLENTQSISQIGMHTVIGRVTDSAGNENVVIDEFEIRTLPYGTIDGKLNSFSCTTRGTSYLIAGSFDLRADSATSIAPSTVHLALADQGRTQLLRFNHEGGIRVVSDTCGLKVNFNFELPKSTANTCPSQLEVLGRGFQNQELVDFRKTLSLNNESEELIPGGCELSMAQNNELDCSIATYSPNWSYPNTAYILDPGTECGWDWAFASAKARSTVGTGLARAQARWFPEGDTTNCSGTTGAAADRFQNHFVGFNFDQLSAIWLEPFDECDAACSCKYEMTMAASVESEASRSGTTGSGGALAGMGEVYSGAPHCPDAHAQVGVSYGNVAPIVGSYSMDMNVQLEILGVGGGGGGGQTVDLQYFTEGPPVPVTDNDGAICDLQPVAACLQRVGTSVGVISAANACADQAPSNNAMDPESGILCDVRTSAQGSVNVHAGWENFMPYQCEDDESSNAASQHQSDSSGRFGAYSWVIEHAL